METTVARAHHVASLMLLGAGVLWLLVEGPGYAALVKVTPLIVLGAFTVLILGTSRLLMAGLHGLVLPGPRWLAWIVLGLACTSSVGVFVSLRSGWAASWAALAGTSWGAAMVLHSGVFFLAHVRRRTAVAATGPRSVSPYGPLMVGAGVIYGLAGAVALPLALMGRFPLFVAYHLLLPGFVTLFVLGVATRVLLGVDRSGLQGPLLAFMVAAAAIAPALIAWGMARSPTVLRAGAVLEGLAIAVFILGVALRLGSSRPRRPSVPAYVLAVAFLLVGISLGVAFAMHAPTRLLVPVHALLNLLGFVGLFCIGAATDLYAPATQPGLAALRRETQLVTALAAAGVVMSAAGTWVEAGVVARVGLGVYLVALIIRLAGAVSSSRRAAGIARRVRRSDAAPAGRDAAHIVQPPPRS